ncbi:hypothetical protein Anapl_01845 [Anas platyrhynchos]|uniref:Uncharacterized protein n=1 Tax=Anas platyrhynchos TaxID=8839 RepID=R0KF10_ANAPL|nr:hypothetical protein Anapl_01845 [Anas platyrhynchos]
MKNINHQRTHTKEEEEPGQARAACHIEQAGSLLSDNRKCTPAFCLSEANTSWPIHHSQTEPTTQQLSPKALLGRIVQEAINPAEFGYMGWKLNGRSGKAEGKYSRIQVALIHNKTYQNIPSSAWQMLPSPTTAPVSPSDCKSTSGNSFLLDDQAGLANPDQAGLCQGKEKRRTREASIQLEVCSIHNAYGSTVNYDFSILRDNEENPKAHICLHADRRLRHPRAVKQDLPATSRLGGRDATKAPLRVSQLCNSCIQKAFGVTALCTFTSFVKICLLILSPNKNQGLMKIWLFKLHDGIPHQNHKGKTSFCVIGEDANKT